MSLGMRVCLLAEQEAWGQSGGARALAMHSEIRPFHLPALLPLPAVLFSPWAPLYGHAKFIAGGRTRRVMEEGVDVPECSQVSGWLCCAAGGLHRWGWFHPFVSWSVHMGQKEEFSSVAR